MLCYRNGADNKDHFENSKQCMHNKSGIVNFLQTQQEITSDWPFLRNLLIDCKRLAYLKYGLPGLYTLHVFRKKQKDLQTEHSLFTA